MTDTIDCGDNSCRYAKNKRGMRTNGGCRCDECPQCGARIDVRSTHRASCLTPEWRSPYQQRHHSESVTK